MSLLADLVRSGITIEQIERAVESAGGSSGSFLGGSGIVTFDSSIGQSVAMNGIAAPAPTGFFALIDSATQDGTNYRWTYSIKEAEDVTTSGFPEFTELDGGRTGNAYNIIELNNSSTGLFGNGVTTDDLGGTDFEIQPVPDDQPVFIIAERDQNGTTIYYFQYENGLAGGCGAS
jgi:hypothetical protein